MRTLQQLFQFINKIMANLAKGSLSMTPALEVQLTDLLIDCYAIAPYDVNIFPSLTRWMIELFQEGRYGFSQNMDQLNDLLNKRYLKFTSNYFYQIPVQSLDMNNAKQNIADFIQKQKTIRVLIDAALNYGNQATNINLINYLRKLGFNGTIQIIHSVWTKEVVDKLLDLKGSDADKKYLAKAKLEVMDFDEFLRKRNNNEIDAEEIAITGAVNIGFENSVNTMCAHPLDVEKQLAPYQNNLANIMNVKLFLMIPYAGHGADVVFYRRDNPAQFILEGSRKSFVVTPVTHLNQTEKYLQYDSRGVAFSQKAPVLINLVKSIKKQTLNMLPVYSRTLRESSHSYICRLLTNIIDGAIYAHDRQSEKKPLVIAIFQNLSEEVKKYLAETYQEKISFNHLFMGNLYDDETNYFFKSMRSDSILFIEMGSLPKVIFDGMFAHDARNIWPPIREGVGSGSTLALRGKAHAFCMYRAPWEVYDLLPEKSREAIQGLDVCRLQNPEAFGRAILEAQNDNSLVTASFLELKTFFENPRNNKIDLLLTVASSHIYLSPEQLNQLYFSFLYYGFPDTDKTKIKQNSTLVISTTCEDKQSSFTISEDRIVTQIAQISAAPDTLPIWMKFISYLTDPVADFISDHIDTLKNSVYFQHENYWGSQSPQTFFTSAEILPKNAVQLLSHAVGYRLN